MTIALGIVGRWYKDRRGVSAIEAAIALPVLIMFLLGLFEFSMAMRYQAAFNDAVAQTARYATLSPTPTVAQVRTRLLSSSTVPLTGATVTVTSGTNAAGRSYYDMSITYNYPVRVPFVSVSPVRLTATERAFVG